MNHHFNAIMIGVTATMLFTLAYIVNESDSFSSTESESKIQSNRDIMPETIYDDNYESLKAPDRTVVIYPIFTQSAYDWNGIHDFFSGRCDSCTTVEIQNFYEKFYSSSGNGFTVLEFLDYDIIDDIELDKDPSILERYDKVILLHNEFVTKAEFDAIANHPNVIYLYPNALSSHIEANYVDNTITLLRGPNYPENGIKNGFDWKFDNSQYMKDWGCNNWKFYTIDNGYMLNCYPEQLLLENGHTLLQAIKDL